MSRQPIESTLKSIVPPRSVRGLISLKVPRLCLLERKVIHHKEINVWVVFCYTPQLYLQCSFMEFMADLNSTQHMVLNTARGP